MSKIHANASGHSAHSYGHIEKLEVQLKAEVQNLLEQAEKADQSDLPDGISLPEELKCWQDRLAVMEQGKVKIEARAAETGKKPGGKLPKPPEEGPGHLTSATTPRWRWPARACWSWRRAWSRPPTSA